MPWNEPGGNKDPWSKKTNGQGPPDLDELLRKWTGKLGGMFGGRGPSSGGSGPVASGATITIFGAIALLFYIFTGFYIVTEGDRGVELRFGEFVETTDPGWHWHIPWPVEREEIVQFDRVSSVQHKATMLTEDENIVDVELAVQYLVNDAPNFLFNVRDDLAERNPEQRADQSVVQALESAVREVVGKSKMDFILGEGRAEIAANTKTRMQEMLDDYGRGVVVTTVNMQQAQPPEQVQAAFDDAIKAREDQVRFRNKAEAYSNDIIPQARGRAARLEQESNAYRDRVIARSEGEAARFEKLLAEYEKAPGVTRERLYLDAVESVLSKSSKVMLDVEGGNNLLYLPLDRLIQEGGSRRAAAPGLDDSLDLSGVLDNQSGQSSRGREVR